MSSSYKSQAVGSRLVHLDKWESQLCRLFAKFQREKLHIDDKISFNEIDNISLIITSQLVVCKTLNIYWNRATDICGQYSIVARCVPEYPDNLVLYINDNLSLHYVFVEQYRPDAYCVVGWIDGIYAAEVGNWLDENIRLVSPSYLRPISELRALIHTESR